MATRRLRHDRAWMLGSRLALAQGIYFTATGVWSLVGIRSFQKVTGPKTDVWLVKTVGVLVIAIGATLIASSRRPSRERVLLGASSAAALAAIDCWYVARGRIAPVYLADAAAELAIVAGWAASSRTSTLV